MGSEMCIRDSLRRRLMDDLGVAGLTDAIGPGHFYASVRLAVEAFEEEPHRS